MKTIEFKITGTTAFLFNKFNIEDVSNKSKIKVGTAGNNPEEWKAGVICEGVKLFIPSYYFFSSIAEGGGYVKQGRGSIKKKLMGCFIMKGDKFFLNYELPKPLEEMQNEEISRDSSQQIYLDIRAVKNPMTKGKNVRYRLGMCPGWSTTVMAEWDDSVLSRDNIRLAIESAGKFAGVGDARLLGHGRYKCVDIKIY